jgi:hypothetical protein
LVHCILQFEYLQHLVSLTCGGHVWRINFRCKVGQIVNIPRGPMRMQNQCRADRPSKPDRNQIETIHVIQWCRDGTHAYQ